MSCIRLSLIILCLIFCSTTNCAAQDYSFKIYSIKDGLSGSEVSNILIDHRGYLWITTEGGLSRYDGIAFKNFSPNNGLPTGAASYGSEDSAGNIWLTYRENVSVFDGSKFTTYPIVNPPKNIWITELLFTANHKIWFVTGKELFELQGSAWKRIDLYKLNLHSLYAIVELKDHSLLINYGDSLVIRHPNGYCQTIAHEFMKDQPFLFLRLAGEDCFISTYKHLYVLRNNQLELFHDKFLAGKGVRTVFMDREHRLWVGTQQHGIYVFSSKNYTQIDSLAEKIYLVESFCQDLEGNIWAATTSGLMKINISWIKLYDSLNYQKTEAALFCSSFKDQNGTLFFGQVNQGFMMKKNGKFTSSFELLGNDYRDMVNQWIQGIACDDQNHLWLTENNETLVRIIGNRAENMSNKFGLTMFNDNPIVFNPSDRTIYTSNRYGLIGIKSNKVHAYPLYGIGEDRIYGLSTDNVGNVWMLTAKGKVFEKCGDKIFHLSRELQLDSVSTIRKIKCYQDNELWISSHGDGIYKFHRNLSGAFEKDFHISVDNGLPNNYVADFTFDKKGRLWVITLSGLASVQFFISGGKENFAITKYNDQDGVRNTNFQYSALVTDGDGNIWLATQSYLAEIISDRLLNDTIPPFIHVENVKLFNSSNQWTKYASKFTPFFHLPEKPVLPYNQNDISIEYKAIGFNDPENFVYSYKLDGIDKGWSNNGTNTRVSFGNLSPGKYTFKVRAKKPFSTWSSNEAKFSFKINPPWWGTIWFKILSGLLFLCLVYLIYRFRVKQILTRSKFEKQISEVEMKALRSQMNPHFIFNSLNSILCFIQSDNSAQASQYLISFSKLMRLILENSLHPEVPLEIDLEALRLYMELESVRLHHKFTFEINTGCELDIQNTMIPPLLLQPFVENAIWHGMANKESSGKILVSVNRENDTISCVVEDDGIGREKAAQLKTTQPKRTRESLGLKLTRDRIDIINRTKNSKASIILTDLYDDSKNSIGTRVVVRLPLELAY